LLLNVGRLHPPHKPPPHSAGPVRKLDRHRLTGAPALSLPPEKTCSLWFADFINADCPRGIAWILPHLGSQIILHQTRVAAAPSRLRTLSIERLCPSGRSAARAPQGEKNKNSLLAMVQAPAINSPGGATFGKLHRAIVAKHNGYRPSQARGALARVSRPHPNPPRRFSASIAYRKNTLCWTETVLA